LPRSARIRIVFGLLTVAIGTIPLLAALGILPSRPPAPGDAPAWLGWAIGLAFFLAGIVVILRSFAGADDSSAELPAAAPRVLRAVYDALAAVIPVLLAVLLSWVAFGPGERQFSVAAGSGGIAMAVGGGGQVIGRVAFGFGAVLARVIVAGMMVSLARRWFMRR